METIENIKTDEGYRAEPYLCSAGKLTWLYGRNIEDRPITGDEWNKLSQGLAIGYSLRDWAEVLFIDETVTIGEELLKHGIKRATLIEEVYIIILNMAYNMGTSRFNPKTWPKFFKAIEKEDYLEASRQMIDSKWWVQVGRRSRRLVNSMQNIESGA